MIHASPTEDQKTHARSLASTDFKQHRFGGGMKQRAWGFLSQTIMADLLGLPRPSPGPDPGYDFVIEGKTVDLKTMIGQAPYHRFSQNIAAPQFFEHGVDAYLFAYVHEPEKTVTFLGFIPKWQVKEKDWFHAKGEKRPRRDGSFLELPIDTIEVPFEAIQEVNTVQDLTERLKKLVRPVHDLRVAMGSRLGKAIIGYLQAGGSAEAKIVDKFCRDYGVSREELQAVANVPVDVNEANLKKLGFL